MQQHNPQRNPTQRPHVPLDDLGDVEIEQGVRLLFTIRNRGLRWFAVGSGLARTARMLEQSGYLRLRLDLECGLEVWRVIGRGVSR